MLSQTAGPAEAGALAPRRLSLSPLSTIGITGAELGAMLGACLPAFDRVEFAHGRGPADDRRLRAFGPHEQCVVFLGEL